MSDFEDKLNKLLNDPDEMERFAGFAKSLMSGSAAEQPEPAPEMDRAMKIARLAGIAELAAEKLGGDDDGGI